LLAPDFHANEEIQNPIEVSGEITGEETQDHPSVFLEQSILVPVAPPGGGIPEVLVAIQFDGQTQARGEEIHLHETPIPKGNFQAGVHLEKSRELRVAFEPPMEECLARAARFALPVSIAG
jgi:hypothetical protein